MQSRQAVRAVHISTKLANCRCDVNLYLQGDQVSYVIGTQQYSKAVKLNMVIFRMVKSRNFNELRNSKLAWSPSIFQKRDNNLLFYICFRYHYQILLLLPWKSRTRVSEKSAFMAFILEKGTYETLDYVWATATAKEHSAWS